MSSSPGVTIPNIDQEIIQKLQNVVNTIDTNTGTFNTAASGITTTQGSVKNAISSVVAVSQGRTIDALSTTWQGTTKDGGKGHDAITTLTTHLTALKNTINDQLPAIKTGMAAILTAQTDQQKSTTIDANTASQLQGQINGLLTALVVISTAAGPMKTSIDGISIGGTCSTGIQPGDPLPNFDNTSFSMKGEGTTPPRTFTVDSNGTVEETPPGGGSDGGNGGDDSGGGGGDDGGDGGDDGGDAQTKSLLDKIKQELNLKNPWRTNVITKLVIGYGIGAVNNVLSSIISHQWLWGPFATGGLASTVAGFFLASLPFPENAIAQTVFGQAVNLGSYYAFKGPSASSNATTTTLPNGATQVTEKLKDGSIQTTTTETNGVTLQTTKHPNGATIEILQKTDGSVEVVDSTRDGTTITTVSPHGKPVVTTLPPGAPLPTLVPAH